MIMKITKSFNIVSVYASRKVYLQRKYEVVSAVHSSQTYGNANLSQEK
jgi:hypothetical protein